MLLRCRRRTSRRTSARGRRTARGSRWRTRACSARTAPTRRCARASATRDASLIYVHRGKRRSGAARTSPRRGAAWTERRPSRRRRGPRRSRRSRRRTRRPRRIDCPLSPRLFVSLALIIHILYSESSSVSPPGLWMSRGVLFEYLTSTEEKQAREAEKLYRLISVSGRRSK